MGFGRVGSIGPLSGGTGGGGKGDPTGVGGFNQPCGSECTSKAPYYECKPGTEQCQEYDFACVDNGYGAKVCSNVPGEVVEDAKCSPSCKTAKKLLM
jgi:hypothetical protein